MNFKKKLTTLALTSLLLGCQTQFPNNYISKSANVPLVLDKPQEKISPDSNKIYSSIYPINNYMGYYYQNGKVMLVVFPKTIIDEIYEGDYKIIRAR